MISRAYRPLLDLVAAHAGATRHMSQSTPHVLLACNVYVSEGKQTDTLKSLQHTAASLPGAHLANVFTDEPYNRTNFTLMSSSPAYLAEAAVTLSRAALAALDLRKHTATHPRLGIVDHMSCHPLTDPAAHIELAADVARAIAESLGAGPPPVPTYLYGKAHPQFRELADVRRQLGYFSKPSSGGWTGALDPEILASCPPDFGPGKVPEETGVCCIGAVPWIINYNILLDTSDMELARKVTQAVSQRAGGLQHVQAMALRHAEGIEVACNLLDPQAVTSEDVSAVVGAAAQRVGVKVLRGYKTGKDIDDMLLIGAKLST